MKNTRLRHAEYYGMTETFDALYAQSKDNQPFQNLMSIITTDDNILLAYRNIKRNNGSATAGVDDVSIHEIEKLSTEEFIEIVKKRFRYYQPRKARGYSEAEWKNETPWDSIHVGPYCPTMYPTSTRADL